MAGNNDAGRIMPLPKGLYNAATAYEVLDIVSYENNLYMAKQSTTGNLPTNTTYWVKLIEGFSVDSTMSDSSENPVQNKVVKAAIDAAVSSVYKPSGSVAFANLPTLSASVVGNVYDVTDAFTTTNDFVEGAGNNYSAHTNVVVVDVGSSTYKFDVLSGLLDTSTLMVKGADYVTAGKKSGTTLGICATAEGSGTTASGQYSHAEGSNNTAEGYASHAEGGGNTIGSSSQYAHVEGTGNTTTSVAYAAHVEGANNTASGMQAHAEGLGTSCSGNQSHAGGYGTIAQRASQMVIGEYNIADTGGLTPSPLSKGTYVFIIGNGSNSARSNALTVDWNGNVIASGTLKGSGGVILPINPSSTPTENGAMWITTT